MFGMRAALALAPATESSLSRTPCGFGPEDPPAICLIEVERECAHPEPFVIPVCLDHLNFFIGRGKRFPNPCGCQHCGDDVHRRIIATYDLLETA